MGWKRDLYGNCRRVRQWATKLQDAYLSSSWNQPRVASGYLGSLVIELDNLIVDALRAYAVALVRMHQSQGLSVRRIGTRHIRSDEFNALVVEFKRPQVYVRRNRPLVIARRDCPNVRSPREMRDILLGIGVAGVVDLQNAISLNYSVFDELKYPRHYYAHRNFATLDALRRNAAPLTSGAVSSPEDYLHFRNPNTGEPQFMEWADQVRTFFEVATSK